MINLVFQNDRKNIRNIIESNMTSFISYIDNIVIKLLIYIYIYIQYWCIDRKYRIYVMRLRNGGKTSFSESFHPFRAEPHKFYIYRQYSNIVFILQYNLGKKMLFNLIIIKKRY